MTRGRIILAMALAAMQVASVAEAVQTRLSGHVESQARWFQSSPTLGPFSAEQQEGLSGSVAVQPEWRYQTRDRKHDFAIVPFARFDADDDERTHVDIRQLYWLYHGKGWEVLAGIDKVFWGVAESRHLVDIVNQTDLVEDPDEEDKLGQIMIRLTMDLKPALGMTRIIDREESKQRPGWGKLSLFLLPGFRERPFPGQEGRLRASIPVDQDNSVFTDGAKKDRVDLALRYSHTLGNWDVGLHYFHGNSREPRLVPDRFRLDGSSPVGGYFTALIPHYDRINQVGLDVQYTRDAWLGKFEGIVREGQGDTFGAVVAGVEYTRYQLFDSNADLGLLVEYLYDGRDMDDPQNPVAPVTPFDNDLFLGTRLSLNDVKNTTLLAGVMTDLETDERFFSVEAERRINNNISAELLLRVFDGDEPNGAFSGIKEDDYVQFSLFYHF
uniref:Alginate export domain-containing protein n=1 Tax=Candidatus Kentrum sp. DK TaxID=2126562 RepID=A0A450SHQ0_9GAMM|nr:MAG: hypothetical protein BECKDK2373C_GA0170839_103729 [Candidatus Kentron sp. DK]